MGLHVYEGIIKVELIILRHLYIATCISAKHGDKFNVLTDHMHRAKFARGGWGGCNPNISQEKCMQDFRPAVCKKFNPVSFVFSPYPTPILVVIQ